MATNLLNRIAGGKLDVLTDDVCDFLQSGTIFTPLSPDDTFLPLGADSSVPDTYIISVAEVSDSLSRIKTNNAAGPDEIPNWILRDYATTLAPPVCAISWITAIAGDQGDPQQFGSVKGTSTVHALIELVHRWKAALDSSGTMIRVLIVDFSKAFERVDHHILLTECTSLGLPNCITKWLTYFLCERKQRVKCKV